MPREYTITVEFSRTETYVLQAESKQELLHKTRDMSEKELMAFVNSEGDWLSDSEPLVSHVRIRLHQMFSHVEGDSL